jgi:hypothetical protein
VPKNDGSLTLKELRPIVQYYHSHFPTWRVILDDSLVREAAPVIQGVTVERLSYGAYRMIGYVRVLVAPRDEWAFELPQELNHKLISIGRREHDALRERVVDAMRNEFEPAMDEPLNPEGVLQLYETRSLPTIPQAYSLAALNAYLERADRCVYWCERFQELLARFGRPPSETDILRQSYLSQLRQWLDKGTAREQLEQILLQERRKWGLA